jgi:glycerate kinase
VTYVLVASDKFKGSLTAAAVGEAVSAGIRGVYPNTEVVVAPVADGGDGTLAAAIAAGFQAVPVTASGRPVSRSRRASPGAAIAPWWNWLTCRDSRRRAGQTVGG